MKPSLITYLFLIFSIQFATASNSTAVANICQNAIDANCGAVFHGKYEDLTNDVNLVCGNVSNPQKELVFKFNATTSTNLQVVVDYDYGGVDVTDVTDVTFSVMSACDASTCITNYTGELIEFSNWVGELYFVISFPAPGGPVGDYTILFSCNDEPGGNACDNAVPLTIGQTYSYQGNEAAQQNWIGELQCPNAFTTHMLALDRTHTFTLETTSTVKVAIDAGIYSPNFSLFFGCDFKKICLRSSSGYSTIDLPNLSPGIYTIVVESLYFPELSYDLLVTNLDCTSASTINCGSNIEGSNNFATNDVFQNNCNFFPAPDVLYKYEHLGNGDLTVSLQTDNNTQLEVAIFDNCNVSSCVAFGTLGTTYANAPAGTYYILVDGNQSNDYDDYTLYVNCPPITNDDCIDAPPITVSSYGNCNFISGSTIGSTDDGPHSCENGLKTGVWYKFVAPPSGVIVYQLSNYTQFFFPNVVVFDACNGNEVHCARYKYRVGNLTAGVTYYLNVTSDVGKETDFSLCLYEPPAPPANDLCTNSITVPIRPKDGCTFNNRVHGTLVGATSDPEPSCTSTAPLERNGVWYNFVAPNSGSVKLDAFNHNSFSYPDKMVVYDDCNGNEIFCSTFPGSSDTIKNLVGGQTYQINIFNYAEKEGEFSFCLEDVVQNIPSCATYSTPWLNATNTGTVLNFTWSEENTASGYKAYVGTDGNGNQTPTSIENGTLVTTSNFPSFYLDNLQPNTTYYWQIVPTNAVGDAENCPIWTFQTATVPANNLCINAANLAVASSCNYILYSNLASSNSMQLPEPQCKTLYTDVWFKVVVPNSGNLTIETSLDETNTATLIDVDMEIYSGDCSSGLTSIACGGDIAPNPSFPDIPNFHVKLELSDPTLKNQIVYVRVWSGNGVQGTFNICAYEPSQSNVSCAILDSPNDQAVDVQTDPTLTWNSVSNAVGYKIYVGTDGNGASQPSNLVNGTVTDDSSGPSYTLFGLSPVTTYYWQIVPYNDNLEEAENCLIYSFTTREDSFSCPEDIVSAEIRNQPFPDILSANNSIESTDTIETSMLYLAGQSISLLPGFHAKAGSDFFAFIAPCLPSPSSIQKEEETALNLREKLDSVIDTPNEMIEESRITIFPNPFTNSTTIQYELPDPSPLHIHLYDMNGRLVQTLLSTLDQEAGVHQLTLDSNDLEAGMYYLNMVSKQERLAKKVMVLK